jgi:PTH1 family peptidyl-tRNA hydrolase
MEPWLITGLGNPGKQYEQNRHNIGFMVIDEIARSYGFSSFKSKYQGLVSEGTIKGQKLVLLKPQTYMNLSGQSVGAAAKFYKIPPSQIIALHDELDLAPGKMRVKKGGGNAGHNGLKSMQAHLGTPDFVRVRLGIGHPGDKDRVSGYVLSDFAKNEQNWLNLLIGAVSDYLPLLINGQDTEFMSKVASQTNQNNE